MHNVAFSIMILEILVINNFASNENKEKEKDKDRFLKSNSSRPQCSSK